MASVKGFSAVAQFVGNPTLDPTNVPANSMSKETFTVNGLDPSMIPVVQAPSLESGLVLVSARASAANTLELCFLNLTGADIDPASQVFNVIGL